MDRCAELNLHALVRKSRNTLNIMNSVEGAGIQDQDSSYSLRTSQSPIATIETQARTNRNNAASKSLPKLASRSGQRYPISHPISR
jgi:hypothetical protein